MTGLDLGKQVGPLPLGAWLAVVGVGLGVGYYGRSNSGATTTAPTDTTASALDPNSADTVGTGVNGQWVDVNPPTSPSPQGPPADNDEWGRRAINDLIALGINPALAQSAVANGLQGNTMSVQQYAVWTMALGKLGAPPFPIDVVPPPVSVPGPVTPATSPVVTARKKTRKGGRAWKIAGGQSLAGISKSVYGSPAYAHAIYQANRKGARRPGMRAGFLTSPNQKLPAGRFLYLPVEYV